MAFWEPLGSFPGLQGGLCGPRGVCGGPRGGEFQAAVDFCCRYSPRCCRDFWGVPLGGFWHIFIVLSRRVDFRCRYSPRCCRVFLGFPLGWILADLL